MGNQKAETDWMAIKNEKTGYRVFVFIASSMAISGVLFNVFAAMNMEDSDGEGFHAIARFDPEIVSFGEVPEGMSRFEGFFVNTSEVPIRVRDVLVGCSCTALNITHQPVHPGERIQYNGLVDFSGMEGVVNIQATATVECIGGGNRSTEEVSLRICGHVLPAYSLEPSVISVRKGDGDRYVKLVSGVDSDVTIVSARSSHLAIIPAVIDSNTVVVKFEDSFWKQPQPGPVNIRIETSSRLRPAYYVKVTVN